MISCSSTKSFVYFSWCNGLVEPLPILPFFLVLKEILLDSPVPQPFEYLNSLRRCILMKEVQLLHYTKSFFFFGFDPKHIPFLPQTIQKRNQWRTLSCLIFLSFGRESVLIDLTVKQAAGFPSQLELSSDFAPSSIPSLSLILFVPSQFSRYKSRDSSPLSTLQFSSLWIIANFSVVMGVTEFISSHGAKTPNSEAMISLWKKS